ncbi:MAG: hypothetical protein ACI31S_04145 [Bacilli bacterium]
MKETLICTLEKHHIYYLNDAKCSFYIAVPFKEYDETNLTIRLKSNYQTYDLSKNSLEIVTKELINYYKSIDNYNITLILPVFYDDILLRIRTVNDMEIYQKIDHYLGNIFNESYIFLKKNNIKVNNNIYIINNDSFKNFTNWFVSRYNNRIEYKTVLELAKEDDNFNNYNVVKTPTINFVVGKNEIPELAKTVELEIQTFDNLAKDLDKENNLSRQNGISKRKEESSGFVSYILLGIISLGLSLLLLYILIK